MTVEWPAVQRHTPARIGLGRTGVSLPTARHLDFQLAHAQARDAVHTSLDCAGIAAALACAGHEVLQLRSMAPDRARRPSAMRSNGPVVSVSAKGR